MMSMTLRRLHFEQRSPHGAPKLTPYQAVLRLQRAGLAAAVVENLEDLWRDPQLRSRGGYRDVFHPDIGWRELPASPDQIALGLPRTTRPGARLGADTTAVLQAWLGLSDEEIDELEDSDACWRPPKEQHRPRPTATTKIGITT